MNTHVAEILELSVAERLDIVGDIWDSIAADSDQLPISDELKAELDRRSELYRKDPEAGVSWEVLEARLRRVDEIQPLNPTLGGGRHRGCF